MNFVSFAKSYNQLPALEKQEDDQAEDSVRTDRRYGFLSTIVFGIVAFVAGLISSHGFYSISNRPLDQLNSALNYVPKMPLRSTTFGMQTSLMDIPNVESNQAWDDLFPTGYGYVNVSDPSSYNLRPGVTTPSGVDIYSVTMFHQLHCLNHIRDFFWLLVDGILTPSALEQVKIAAEKEIHDHHSQHCLEYLVKTVKCSADLTLEWAHVEKDGSRTQVDGSEVPRICKDSDAIWEWMEANHGPPRALHHIVPLSA